jgi:hypothetical protein
LKPAKKLLLWKKSKLQECSDLYAQFSEKMKRMKLSAKQFKVTAGLSAKRLNEIKKAQQVLIKSIQALADDKSTELQFEENHKKLKSKLESKQKEIKEKQSRISMLKTSAQKSEEAGATLADKIEKVNQKLAIGNEQERLVNPFDSFFLNRAYNRFRSWSRVSWTSLNLNQGRWRKGIAIWVISILQTQFPPSLRLKKQQQLLASNEKSKRLVQAKAVDLKTSIQAKAAQLKDGEQQILKLKEDLPIWSVSVKNLQTIEQKKKLIQVFKVNLNKWKNDVNKIKTEIKTTIEEYCLSTLASVAKFSTNGRSEADYKLKELQKSQEELQGLITIEKKRNSALNEEHAKLVASIKDKLEKNTRNKSKRKTKLGTTEKKFQKELLRLKKTIAAKEKIAEKLRNDASQAQMKKSSSSSSVRSLSLSRRSSLEAGFAKQMRLRREEHQNELDDFEKILKRKKNELDRLRKEQLPNAPKKNNKPSRIAPLITQKKKAGRKKRRRNEKKKSSQVCAKAAVR